MEGKIAAHGFTGLTHGVRIIFYTKSASVRVTTGLTITRVNKINIVAQSVEW